MYKLSLKDIHKSFGTVNVLKGISLDVEEGEFISLVGSSGCGKSTLLRIIAGLETETSGSIVIDGVEINQLPPKMRNIAMVFQDYALYPYMTVGENMAMPLVMATLPLHARLPILRYFSPASRRAAPLIKAQVEKTAKQLQIEHLLSRRPAQLSGGQRQRAALGRALVRNPQVFLLDEPLSNLDAKLRVQVRTEISELHKTSGLTFIYVTHDQVEAMTMSDKIAMLDQGRLVQVGTTNELYSDPVNIDVARFIGSPEINTIAGKVDGKTVRVGSESWPIQVKGDVSNVTLGFRPDSVLVKNENRLSKPFEPSLSKTVRLKFCQRLSEDLGPELFVHGHLEGIPESDIRIRAQKITTDANVDKLNLDQYLEIEITANSLLLFDPSGNRVEFEVV